MIGLGRNPPFETRSLGVIDAMSDDPAVVADADLVLIATPVGQMSHIMEAIAPHLSTRTVVTDAGSTKLDVVALAYRKLQQSVGQFVPGHPIAGAEASGVAAAKADLFRSRRVVLTPLPENSAANVRKVRAAWLACGAKLHRTGSRARPGVRGGGICCIFVVRSGGLGRAPMNGGSCSTMPRRFDFTRMPSLKWARHPHRQPQGAARSVATSANCRA